MNIYNFITTEKIKEISENFKSKTDFEFRKTIKEYTLEISSSRARVDFEDGTKKGEYIAGISLFAKSRGNGGPLGSRKLKELQNHKKLTSFIDEWLTDSKIEGYQKIGEGQLNLFTDIKQGKRGIK